MLTTQNSKELIEQGWTLVNGVKSKEEFLALGKLVGIPILTPNNEFVKEIRRCEAHLAPKGSQSALYGSGAFPLHTDTVFWGTPVRYVMLRGYGDNRRPTTIQSLIKIKLELGRKGSEQLRRSIWSIHAGTANFYSTAEFKINGCNGIRLDMDLMRPANKDALNIAKELETLVNSIETEKIFWNNQTAAIIDNWKILHGRGTQPSNEGERVVERLYIGEENGLG